MRVRLGGQKGPLPTKPHRVLCGLSRRKEEPDQQEVLRSRSEGRVAGQEGAEVFSLHRGGR